MLPLGDKAVKAGKSNAALFRMFCWGNSSNRDAWVYDTDAQTEASKAKFLSETYNSLLKAKDRSFPNSIKWSADLKVRFENGNGSAFDESLLVNAHWRPFSKVFFYSEKLFNDRLTENHVATFGSDLKLTNEVMMICDHHQLPFTVHAVDGIPDAGYSSRATQMFARWTYSEDGNRIDNITDWALKQFRDHYKTSVTPAKAGVQRLSSTEAKTLDSRLRGNDEQKKDVQRDRQVITKEAIFHYVYAVLHDPIYREKYAQNLKREFPRIPFYEDFWRWDEWGKTLMDLHIGYEAIAPWPLTRTDTPDEKARKNGAAPKAMLKADKDIGRIALDSETVLTGIPPEVWNYKLGNRSALEWILDQYKEKTPKDPTIRARFNTYRFADYKEKVIDLLARVTRVSVETQAIVEAMKSVAR